MEASCDVNILKRSIVKPGFHIIVTIVWIPVNDSSDLSDPKDQDRSDRICSIPAIHYRSERNNPLATPLSISGVVESDSNDRNDYMETRLYEASEKYLQILVL